jgi:diguanylate cyclase (GGDEF)-like protein
VKTAGSTAAASVSSTGSESEAMRKRAAALRAAGSQPEQIDRINLWLEVALNNMARGLSMFDANQKLILCNEMYRQIYALPEYLTRPGTPLALIVRHHVKRETGRDRASDQRAQRQWISSHLAKLALGKPFNHTQQLSSGRTILVTNQPLSDGSWVDLQEDITERCQAEEKISWLARHDALTEVPNRFHFHEQLDQALQGLRHGDGLAVHWIDIDHFKNVNDDLGHPGGDALLRSIGARLRTGVRQPDFVGRLGGDEFAVVQMHVTSMAQATAFAKRILRSIKETHQYMGQRIDIGASIGIAMAPAHGRTADDLLKAADLALYHAKASGRGTFELFDPLFGYEKKARRRLEGDLANALKEGQLELHYQPIVDAKTGVTHSCEALMRWRHPSEGLIPPVEFIPLAEETGLIVAMGEWAIQQACKDAMAWPNRICVTVNLSPLQFSCADLFGTVSNALSRSRLRPDRLELEITESVLLRDDPSTLQTLHKLRALGVRIALDDFGTAFASLSYLRSFPFDTIKIDRSFVREVPQRADCTAIIEAMAGLAKKLQMLTVAEGIETQQQASAAETAGCDQLQGFLFSRPIPAAEVVVLLHKTSVLKGRSTRSRRKLDS